MNAKHLFLAGAAAAAVASLLFLALRRDDPRRVPDGPEHPGDLPSAPAFPRPAGTAVRALPPSALGARTAAARPAPPAPSSGDVAAVTEASDGSLDARLAALARLGKALPAADVGALLGFLDRRNGEDALPPERLNALKNDVANVLRAQTGFPGSLPWRLAAMWRDPGHDDVWRDYCIQHLGASWGRVSDPAARGEIRSVLWSAASDPAAPGSGTALIALRNLAEAGGEDRAEVADRAATCAASPAAPDGVRVTALQIAAGLGHEGAAALARSLLMDRRQPVHLRMSAAAALGQVGDASDLPALRTLAAGSEPRLRAAASSAAARLAPPAPRR